MTQDPPQLPEIVDDTPVEELTESVLQPTKLIRIASMVRVMLDEVRRAPIDDAGRRALLSIHERSLRELQSVLSPDLQAELRDVALPLADDATESELRLAQAQLVGWLEGLFHGIQTTLFSQQAAAGNQLDEIRRQRAIEAGSSAQSGQQSAPPGAYL